MSNEIIHISPTNDLAVRQQATDEQLLDLWLHGRSKATQRGYPRMVNAMFPVGHPVRHLRCRLGQSLQTISDSASATWLLGKDAGGAIDEADAASKGK